MRGRAQVLPPQQEPVREQQPEQEPLPERVQQQGQLPVRRKLLPLLRHHMLCR